MLKYIFIEAKSPENLNIAVNEALYDGWTLYGSPQVIGAAFFYQAMVQETDIEVDMKFIKGTIEEKADPDPLMAECVIDAPPELVAEPVTEPPFTFRQVPNECSCKEYCGDDPQCPVHYILLQHG